MNRVGGWQFKAVKKFFVGGVEGGRCFQGTERTTARHGVKRSLDSAFFPSLQQIDGVASLVGVDELGATLT
jgi:hypothetical protein